MTGCCLFQMAFYRLCYLSLTESIHEPHSFVYIGGGSSDTKSQHSLTNLHFFVYDCGKEVQSDRRDADRESVDQKSPPKNWESQKKPCVGRNRQAKSLRSERQVVIDATIWLPSSRTARKRRSSAAWRKTWCRTSRNHHCLQCAFLRLAKPQEHKVMQQFKEVADEISRQDCARGE